MRGMRILRLMGLLLILVFCSTVGHRIDRPLQNSTRTVKADPFKELTRRCVVSGRFVEYHDGRIYIDSPKEGLVRVRVGPKTRILFHNYSAGERLECKDVSEALKKHPDAVCIGVNGVAEDVIFAVIE